MVRTSVTFARARLFAVLIAAGCGGATKEPAKTPASPPSAELEPPAGASAKPLLRFPPHAVQAVPEGPGWLGVELKARGPTEAGVLIEGVLPSSPAAVAGLLPGDVLISVDGQAVQHPPDVVRIVSAHRAGERVALVFERQGQSRIAAVGLAARPDNDALMASAFVGSPAPKWRELTAVQGSVPVDVTALRGRVVVLEFWASWCTVCRMTIPLLNQWHDRYAARGLTVLGVTTDPADHATAASIELGIAYAVHADPEATTSRAYKALAIPTLFLIDREGTVRDVVVGFESQRLAEVEASVQKLLAAR